MAAAIEQRGRLDIACNDAGVAPPSTPLADVDSDLWEGIIAVDLTGVFYGIKAQVPAMIADALALNQKIKDALDPQGIPDPGAVFDSSSMRAKTSIG